MSFRAIHDYLDHRNADPKPFVWTKSAATILEQEARAKANRDTIKNGYQPSASERQYSGSDICFTSRLGSEQMSEP